MKKLLKILAAALALTGFSVGMASAQTITNGNGTGSTNTVTQTSTTRINISNSNDVDCDLDSDQDASSGDATANGNTTVGNVFTGSASNNAFLSCMVNASNGPRPNQPGNNPGGGGQGGGHVAGATTGRGGVVLAASSAQVSALPSTGENVVLENLGMASIIVAIAGIAAQGGVSAYRQSAFKNS